MEDFIELQIISAVSKLLTVKVNEIIGNWNFFFPLVEIGKYNGSNVVNPVISLSSCEQTEKERIIKIDSYSLTITFTVPETPDCELYCYGYSNAFDKALSLDKTLGGIVQCATITGTKYIPPKKPDCGLFWEVIISLRVTTEGRI
ncbi:MAG: hypothetical protein FWD14_04950 [Treponema sp.]|nr:hypothetical protein [Treponema sp.]